MVKRNADSPINIGGDGGVGSEEKTDLDGGEGSRRGVGSGGRWRVRLFSRISLLSLLSLCVCGDKFNHHKKCQ
ncbi:MAG: hypothetical protein SCH39_02530 [Methanosarcinales archaeon]|nr:hypothetical protein [Methanosarcinales archaeon]